MSGTAAGQTIWMTHKDPLYLARERWQRDPDGTAWWWFRDGHTGEWERADRSSDLSLAEVTHCGFVEVESPLPHPDTTMRTGL